MNRLVSHLDLLWNTLSWVSNSQSRLIWTSAMLLAASRILLTMSYFLPIKLLILLASDGPPSYMAYLPASISYDTLLIVLMICVPVFYIGSISASFLSTKFRGKALSKVEESTQQHSKDDAEKIIGAKIPFLSELFVVLGGLAILLIISWSVLLIVMAFIIGLAYLMEHVLFNDLSQTTVTFAKISRPYFIDYCNGFSYIIVFGFIAVIVVVSGLDIFSAILSLLVVRLIMQALQRFFKTWVKHDQALDHLEKIKPVNNL